MKKEITLTKDGKAALEAELKELIDGRAAITEKIATARAFGDLSENEEYSSARAEQKLAENRILEIQNILKNASVVKSKKHSKVVIGSKVEVEVKKKKFTYEIVNPIEANPLEGKISDASPVGKALVGKKEGDEYNLPNGTTGKIISIS